MSSAQWITLPNLGSFTEDRDFDLNPLVLQFAADGGAVVTTLNGAFPPGIRYSRSGNTIQILGQSSGVSSPTTGDATLRITDPDGTIADRTFSMTINPVAVHPSWEGQTPFLGYATVGSKATFTVTATSSDGANIEYRLVRAPGTGALPPGMSIDSATGVITYSNASPVPLPAAYERTYMFVVRAILGSVYEDLAASITVLGADHVPGWLTPPGSLGTYDVGSMVEVDLRSFEPTGSAVAYTLQSQPTGFPFTLTTTGFMYGKAPFTKSSTVWAFTVAATSAVGTSTRSFTITVEQSATNGLMTWVNTTGELGSLPDGNAYNLYVGATSKRSNTVIHTLAGGSLPPDMVLNSTQGYLSGFVEYHPQPRDYYFEIQADDGSQTLTRQYHVSVYRSVNDKFVDVSIPIQGEMADALLTTRNLMINSPRIVPFAGTSPQLRWLGMDLAHGLSYQSDDPRTLLDGANVALHSTVLLIGNTGNANIAGSSSGTVYAQTMFYRDVIDPQANAATQTNRAIGNISSGSSSLPYGPISLGNMRDAIIETMGFANGGLGSEASLLPIIDPLTGGISSVEVIDAGHGYYHSPTMVVTGSGNGAVLTSNITVLSARIINPGIGWSPMQIFNVMVDDSHTVVLRADTVNGNGGMESVSVIDGSSFTIFPQGKRVVTDGSSATAVVSFNLGIGNVGVITSGAGYSLISGNTEVSTSGFEPPLPYQSSWSPIIPIGAVYSTYATSVSLKATPDVESIMGNLAWPIEFLWFTAYGRSWMGNTMFDEDVCQFDGGQTRFLEWDEPLYTVFDNNVTSFGTTFDTDGTTFGARSGLGNQAYLIWGNQIWEPTTSMFDVYGMQISNVDPPRTSVTLMSRIYRLTSQQVGSFNGSL